MTLIRTRPFARALAVAVAGTAGLGALLVGATAAHAVSTPTVMGAQGFYVAGQGAGLPFKGVAQPYTITVKGTNFDSGAKVSLMKEAPGVLSYTASASDVVVVSTTYVSTTLLTVSLQVPTAETASVDGNGGSTPPLVVVVTNGDTGTASCNAPTTALPSGQAIGCLDIHASPTATSPVSTVGRGATAFTRTLSGLSGLQAGTGQLLLDPAVNATVAPFTITGAGDTSEAAKFTVPASSATTTTPADALFINPDGGQGTTTVSLAPGPQLTGSAVPAVIGTDFTQSFSGTSFGNTTSTKVTVAIPALFPTTFMATTSATTSTGSIDFGTVPASAPIGKQTVTVTNPDGGSASAALVNVVAAPTAPSPASVGPVGDGSAVINWNVPSSSGSSAIVNYQITTSPDTGARTVPADQPLTYTLVGLVNGGTYTATIRAVNADSQASPGATTPSFVPNVPAPAPSPTDSPTPTPTPTAAPTTAAPTATPAPSPTTTFTAPVTTLTLSSTSKQLSLTQTVGFSGKVFTDGQPQSNVRVGVAQVGPKGRLTEVVQGTTNASGFWSVKGYTPVMNMKYVATALGATSKSVSVNVGQLLRLTDPQIDGHTVTISGFATPGSSRSGVKIVLFMTDSKGHRIKSIAAYTLGKGGKVKGYSLGASAVKIVRTFKPGSYHVVVQVYGTTTNTAAASKVYSITIS